MRTLRAELPARLVRVSGKLCLIKGSHLGTVELTAVDVPGSQQMVHYYTWEAVAVPRHPWSSRDQREYGKPRPCEVPLLLSCTVSAYILLSTFEDGLGFVLTCKSWLLVM